MSSSSGASLSSLSYLPQELIRLILEHVDSSSTLVSCARVNRQWFKDATAILWRDPARFWPRNISFPMLSELASTPSRLEYYLGLVQHFAIDLPTKHGLPSGYDLEPLLSSNALRSLHPTSISLRARANRNDPLDSELGLDWHLQRLHQLWHPRLFSLDLKWFVGFSAPNMQLIQKQCPNLTCLRVWANMGEAGEPENLDDWMDFLWGMPQLKAIQIETSRRTLSRSDLGDALPALLQMPNLKLLYHRGNFSDRQVQVLGDQRVQTILPQIRDLALGEISLSGLRMLTQSCPNVEGLRIAWDSDSQDNHQIANAEVFKLLCQLQDLKELGVTFRGKLLQFSPYIISLAQNCSNLEYVVLEGFSSRTRQCLSIHVDEIMLMVQALPRCVKNPIDNLLMTYTIS